MLKRLLRQDLRKRPPSPQNLGETGIKSNSAKVKVSIFYLLVFWLTFLSTTLASIPVSNATSLGSDRLPSNPQTLVQQGKILYEAGQFAEAAAVLQQAAEAFQTQGDTLQEAIALSNLALAYQQLGQFSAAQLAITASLQLLPNAATTEELKVQGAAFDIQGQLYLAQGQTESALSSFSSAVANYTKAGDEVGATNSQINQAQALQAMGLYPRALDILRQLNAQLQAQPDSTTKAIAKRSLGNIWRLVGNLADSERFLQESLAVAERVPSPSDISAAWLGLGNTARAQGNTEQALNYYQQAAAAAPIGASTKIEAQLNYLSLLVAAKKPLDDSTLLLDIQSEIEQLPVSHTTVNARINWARSLMELSEQGMVENSALPEIAEELAQAVAQAQIIKDKRGEAYALGQLGALYEQTQQLPEAQKLTEQALILAQSINASDIAYSLQWQLGRLLKTQGERKGAIAAYTSAVQILKSLRGDLVSINPDVQFSFRDSVEPVYRELVQLLLSSEGGEPTEEELKQARDAIESLQQAELINFFREDCLNATRIVIDQVDPKAAVIYPIVLGERLEVVLSLPDAPVRHYGITLPDERVQDTFNQLREVVAPLSINPNRSSSQIAIVDLILNAMQGSQDTLNSFPTDRHDYQFSNLQVRAGIRLEGNRNSSTKEQYLPLAQQVYDWIIRPAEPYLAASETKTLVFVLDGSLLNLPMAVLHDGKEFLVQKYAIAYTPGLQLLDPKPLARRELSALEGGISESRQGFPSLEFVKQELEQIKLQVPGELLLNQNFTSAAVQQAIDLVPFPIVHFATHGQFSSKAEDTFILTWDDRLNINQINNLLRAREGSDRNPIELLVLSACQTAAGDKRAALGLAGVAVKAGARSTLATLWFVDDAATAELMIRFYQELSDTSITKAEALRRAQVQLLKENQSQHPIYWAPFVLVGNWL
ncbi:MAG TPA: hypothetical protein DDZ80_28915 [Cyanobacteria bacterium UBA8803]|nr:hypothetical protein [Cyanobacteria bacterium UBA9273]HBL62277.1 hypothetical protein [Cyanobacteria bacterium UBA8803]